MLISASPAQQKERDGNAVKRKIRQINGDGKRLAEGQALPM